MRVQPEDFGIVSKAVENTVLGEYRLIKLTWKARYMAEHEFSRWLVYAKDCFAPETDAVHDGASKCLLVFNEGHPVPTLADIKSKLDKQKTESDSYCIELAKARNFVETYSHLFPLSLKPEVVSNEVLVRGSVPPELRRALPELAGFWKFSLPYRFKVSDAEIGAEYCLKVFVPKMREHFKLLPSGNKMPKLRNK